jgi:Domain of unknown function (DUF4259)
MGAWGYGSFDNDDAIDFLSELMGRKAIAPIRAAVDAVLRPANGYLDVEVGNAAVAAAEVLVALSGKPSRSVPVGVREWARGKPHPSASLKKKARAALDRILGGKSELHDLWKESKDFAKWKVRVKKLNRRLNE